MEKQTDNPAINAGSKHNINTQQLENEMALRSVDAIDSTADIDHLSIILSRKNSKAQ